MHKKTKIIFIEKMIDDDNNNGDQSTKITTAKITKSTFYMSNKNTQSIPIRA
jgi:hypothetical protein